ncbi:MAG: GNAT family N-acetyltransferase [Alphaproteobacteria bacterium]|nr:GNAT family N-acetyltransferase [Alphaproteobacteria bacterium]
MEKSLEITVAPATRPEDIAAVQELFREYAEFMGFQLCFQGFEKELEGLPGLYAPPSGELLLCRVGGAPAGCVATCRCMPGVAEMKRLYVRPDFRNLKIGRNLAWLAMGMAHEAGYVSIRLETVPDRMPTAVGMYEKLGFQASPCPDGTDLRIVCYTRSLADLV